MKDQTKQGQWFVEHSHSTQTSFGLKILSHLHHEQTPYQTIDVYQTHTFGRLLALDGCIMLTERDNFIYHEMMSHPALLTHPEPKKVLIIGGGDCGTLQEVLKHETVEQATQVELDERVTKICEHFFPSLCQTNQDQRIKFIFTDGNAWVKKQPSQCFDVIIIDSTDPVGAAAVLFSCAFLKECYRILKTPGILIQQSESPLLHAQTIILPLHKSLQQSGFNSINTLQFPQPVYPGGWWSATMAGKALNLSEIKNIQTNEDSTIKTQYYSKGIHHSALELPPFLQQILSHQKHPFT